MVKGMVLLTFTGILFSSIISIQHIELGFGKVVSTLHLFPKITDYRNRPKASAAGAVVLSSILRQSGCIFGNWAAGVFRRA